MRQIATEPYEKGREARICNKVIEFCNELRRKGVDENSIEEGVRMAAKRIWKRRRR